MARIRDRTGLQGLGESAGLAILPAFVRPVLERRSMKLIPLIVATGALSLAATTHAADLDAGRQLAYTCTGCHGIAGYKNAYPNYHVPRIAGQNRDYLVAALTAYSKGERTHPTMRAQGEALSAEEIDNVASYLASLREAP
ncbi:cytochrome c553 [Pseudofulvimonas gallinarii]|jgi:cytochrome c553|uniref:Cytochrome c553 n=2 Tax=Pseudofulvimonas gallinarii TaxID=634155 RepID=A0A4R3L975_9GAMM|nr:cytochrome c553 [Pseudofulvimonas gallinarii]